MSKDRVAMTQKARIQKNDDFNVHISVIYVMAD
jgi:hypothetical protein